MSIDYNKYIEEMLMEKRRGLIDTSSVNLYEVFKVNFLAFEKINAFYKMNKAYAKEHGETACGEIKKILMLNGHIKSTESISDNHISIYMSRVRREQGLTKRKSKPVVGVTPTVKTQAPTGLKVEVQAVAPVQVEGGLDLAEFIDTSWLDEEPEDWAIYFRDKKRPTEWNREFENLWRWIHKKAPEFGMNPYEVKVYSGYKAKWVQCADLFHDLKNFRKAIGLNPEGLGKK